MPAVLDLSPIVQPGDTVLVVLLRGNGKPSGISYPTVVAADGSYTGDRKVAAGRARIESINRPGRGTRRR